MSAVENRFKQIRETKGIKAALSWLYKYKTNLESEKAMKDFEKKLIEKLETGAGDQILDWLNKGMNAAQREIPFKETLFAKGTETDPKVLKMMQQFEEKMQAGGIDEVLDELNEQMRKARRKEGETQRTKIYG